ncbi:hypothetical protein os4_35670 (plasmid) [Comamonadaceae bacterium OS-4]|nr:hypothetical protein os4_35670 [Comamonadaceae bacterium OS-4]
MTDILNITASLWTMGLALLLWRQIRIWVLSRKQTAWHAANATIYLLAVAALWMDMPGAMLLVLLGVGSELMRSKLALRFYREQKRQIQSKYFKD